MKKLNGNKPVSQKKRLRNRVLGSVLGFLLILIVVGLLAGRFLSSPAVIKKIQQAIATRSGVEVVYQSISVRYLPSLAISLYHATLSAPQFGQAETDEIRIVPELLPLFKGEVRLAGLELEQPVISLDLPESEGDTETPDLSSSNLEKLFGGLLAPLAGVASDLDLTVHNARLAIDQHQQPLVAAEQLNLQLHLAIKSPRSARIRMQTSISALNLWRNGHRENLKGFSLDGTLEMADGEFNSELKNLFVTEPALELQGTLSISASPQEISLSLTGSNINVDTIRRSALALAGDVPLVRDVFSYLRGGKIPQLTIQSRASDLAGLGELSNLRLEGELQAGTVSISQIKLDLSDVVSDVLIADGILQATGMSTRLEDSSGHDGTLKMALTKDNELFQLELMLNADLAHVKRILERIVKNQTFIEEMERVTRFAGTGNGKLTLGDSLANLRAKVDVQKLAFSADYQRVPFPIKVTDGKITFAENLIRLKSWQGSVGASQFKNLAATIDLDDAGKSASGTPGHIELALDGELDKNFVDWLEKLFDVPQDYVIKTPLTLTNSRLDWQKSKSAMFAGDVSVQNGPVLAVDVAWQPDQFTFRKLKLKDRYSDCDVTLAFSKGGLDLKFSGALQHESLEALFVQPLPGKGRIEGDFSITAPAAALAGSETSGQLKGTNLSYSLPSGDQVTIAGVALAGNGPRVAAHLSSLSWRYFVWDPVKAEFDFSQEKIKVKITEAKLCGIDSPGEWTIDGKNLALALKLKSQQLDVLQEYTCLTNGKGKLTGTLDVSGQVNSEGQVSQLLTNLQGPLEMKFSNGFIKQDKLLARILEVLNVTEIVKGKLPDLGTQGLAYKTINLQGEFENGKLHITKLHMDGDTLDLLGTGEIDMLEETITLQLLAAPFQTANTIIKHIPGINYLMGGTLVTIPVSVKGPLDDPSVRILSPSSVGSSLLKLAERTIKSPIKLIESLVPTGSE